MDALPIAVLAAALELLDHRDLHAAECASAQLRQAVQVGGLWEKSARRIVVVGDGESPTNYSTWKHLTCLASKPCDHSIGLLDDVTACSSVHRPEESALNTLTPSRCWVRPRSSTSSRPAIIPDEEGIRQVIAQYQCGCNRGDPCYWSSAPSPEKDIQDFIDYTVFPRSIVQVVHIVPYLAFWQPDKPTYGPRAVSVSFYSLRTPLSRTELLYESPVSALVNKMTQQEIVLDQPVWLPHGAIMRLNLIGRYQDETFGIEPWLPVDQQVSNYYTCLSYVNAMGVTMSTGRRHPEQEPAHISLLDLGRMMVWEQWCHIAIPWLGRSSSDTTSDREPTGRQQPPRRRRSHRASTRSTKRSSSAAASHHAWLHILPEEATELILYYLDHHSLHALELSSRSITNAMQSVEFWRGSVADKVVCFEDPLARPAQHSALWKRMHCLNRQLRRSTNCDTRATAAGFPSDTLLTGAVRNDSPNDFSVPPTWLLFKSRCWFWMEKLLNKTALPNTTSTMTTPASGHTFDDAASMYVRQLHCGCGYHVPCFWSSGGSSSPESSSSLTFSIRAHCFLSTIQLVPYQAYWIETRPAFAPRQVSFSVLHGETTYYQSPVYAVTNAMELQHFELPKTVFVASGSVLRVSLIGRTQRAPLDERPWLLASSSSHFTKSAAMDASARGRLFYCCLSYINASGVVVHEERTKKPKKWWLPVAHLH